VYPADQFLKQKAKSRLLRIAETQNCLTHTKKTSEGGGEKT
jgi:hypothetical protein